jgi:molybdate transport system substrate-binding protein
VNFRRLILVLALGLALAACSGASASSVPPSALTVFAAASLRNVLAEVERAYEAANPGAEVTISTDSSAALETKIEQGAPADLFLSADTENPQKLVAKGLAAGELISFAGNELAIIVPTDNPAGIASPKDLADDGVRVIAAGDEVPISTYASRLVDNLAALPGYPDDFAEAYASNVRSREENVSAVVTKIELGEGDAGIVYATDVAASTDVQTVRIPAGSNVPATYAAVVIEGSSREAEAHAFLDWLTGPEGLAILQGLGFQPPPE